MKRFIVLTAVIGVIAACGSTTVAVSTPTPSGPAASPSASSSPTLPAGFDYLDVSGGIVPTSDVTSVRVEQHVGYDRFVIEFASGVPTYAVTRQTSPTFTRSPRGDQVTLAGTAGILITVYSVSNWTSYTGPTGFQPGYQYLQQAMQVQSFEGYQQWALGIKGTPALRVTAVDSPASLIVDVAVAA